MKKVVKIICIVLCVTLLVGIASIFAGCNPKNRNEILKLYMPGEYIDEDIFEEFSAWYKEQTGETVVVQIDEFDAVENIQTVVEGGRADYDLLCPSDYMIEYLIGKELLIQVDKNIINIEDEGLFKQEYITTSREFDPNLLYSVPYMYGTLGLAYDITKTGRKLDSWEDYFGDVSYSKGDAKYKKSLKDSVRDAYAAACLYNARSTTAGLTGESLKGQIQEIFEDTKQTTVDAAKSALLSLKEDGAVWDTDNVKYEIAAGQSNVAVALMWSCDAGYVMNEYEDEDGNIQEGYKDLWYVVPKEGGNVYIDSFVISKYAVNTKAANYFLKFICQKDIAVQNSEYAGAISPVSEAYDELLEYYTVDEDGLFEGTAEGWKEMFIETMFPSTETLNRCGVMKDFGEGKNRVTTMWGNVR
ncbi:MAG: extracellular solute-binding protein [Clostridia bacterium]|nr:extracellular solute-binding protein [Clostridia bacterium]